MVEVIRCVEIPTDKRSFFCLRILHFSITIYSDLYYWESLYLSLNSTKSNQTKNGNSGQVQNQTQFIYFLSQKCNIQMTNYEWLCGL